MTGLYTRWALILGATLLLAILTYQHYQQHLSTLSMGMLLSSPPVTQPVRIQGMVKSGTLQGDVEHGQATFEFVDGDASLAVEYHGPPLENIRELKTLVLIGRWDGQAQVFRAQDTALINNFGFVAAAYLISVLALGWMVFAMSQRVMVLFKEIKESKLYEPEADSLGTKNKKIAIIVSILLVAGSLGYLAFGNFGENIVYFVTPSEVKAFTAEAYNKKVRVGGMVVKGSLKTQPEPVGLTFELTDGATTIPVAFQGIPPDLFKEGQGAVVEGQWRDGRTFHSTMIMAKHSEDYMPMELKRAGVELPKKDFMKTLSP